MRVFILAIALLIATATWAQSGVGGGAQSNVSGGAGGGVTSSLFYIASSCAGLSNCLAWVDDDTTDNCGAATTAWLAQVNAYAGPGESHVYIQGSGSGKAYKLVSCNLAFTGPAGTGGVAGSVSVVSNATIDCAQASGNCIQGGKTGCPTSIGGGFPYATGCHDFTWRGGTFIGGLTNSPAMIEYEQGMYIAILDDVTFNNTGAGNATLGTCTNWTIQYDPFIGGIEMSRNKFFGTVKGQCFLNNNDSVGGANTLIARGNTISHTTGAACGGLLHFDSSAHSIIENNTLFGFANIIELVQNNGGMGWSIIGNNVDTNGCTLPSGNAASITFGSATNNGAVGPVSIIGNNNYSSPFISVFPLSTATMLGWSINGNNDNYTATPQPVISGPSTSCTPTTNGSTGGLQNPCYVGNNPGFLLAGASGTFFPGFITMEGNYARKFLAGQTANVGSTAVNSTALVQGDMHVCAQAIVTTAGTTSTLPSVSITWTDAVSGQSLTQQLTQTSTTNTVGTQSNGCAFVIPTNLTNINMSTSGYASTGTAMQYFVVVNVFKAW